MFVSNYKMIFLIIFVAFLSLASAQTDLTIVENSVGFDVTLATVRKIYNSGIFEDDFFLTFRVGVALNFGQDSGPITDKVGIWRITRQQLEETQRNGNLTGLREKIQGVWPSDVGNWSDISEDDLRKPLHCALAFRLFVETLVLQEVTPIFPFLPALTFDQGYFLEIYFNPEINATFYNDKITTFESSKMKVSSLKADIIFIHDASCSVYPTNFTDGLTYFGRIVRFFDYANLRVGHVVYSNDALINIQLTNELGESEFHEKLMNSSRPFAGYTHPEPAIIESLKMFNTTSIREGVPKILVSYTDGFAVDVLDTITNSTLNAGIETLTVATNFQWQNYQLIQIAHNKPGRILKNGYTYTLSSEFAYRTYLSISSIPMAPPLGQTRVHALGGEAKFYRYDVQGLTQVSVTITATSGNFVAFYSFTEEMPGPAIHLGEHLIDGGSEVIDVPGTESFLYIGFHASVFSQFTVNVN